MTALRLGRGALARVWHARRFAHAILTSGWTRRMTAVVGIALASLAIQAAPLRFDSVAVTPLPGFDSGAWFRSRAGVHGLVDDPGAVILTPARGLPFSYVISRFRAADGARYLRLSAELRTLNIAPGRQSWQRARVLLWSYDRRGLRLNYVPHDLLTADGTHDWTRRTLTVPVLANTAHFDLVIAHAGRAGVLALRDLKAEIVAETALFKTLRVGLIGLWLAVGVWVLYPVVRSAVRPARMLALLCGVTILVAALTPQPEFSEVTHSAVASVTGELRTAYHAMRAALAPARPPAQQASREPAQEPRTGAQAPKTKEGGDRTKAPSTHQGLAALGMIAWPRAVSLDVASHFSGFLTLGVLMAIGYAGFPLLALLGAGALFAGATEALQTFQFSRTAELGDFLFDFGGLACGLVFVVLVRFALRRARAKRPLQA